MRSILKSLRRSKRVPQPQEKPQPEPERPTEAPPARISYEFPAASLPRAFEPELPPVQRYYEVPKAPSIVELELPPTQPCVDAPKPPSPVRPYSPFDDRQRWRDQVRASPLANFVTNGQRLLRQRDVDQLCSVTNTYLTTWESYHTAQGSDRDGILLDLIADWDQDQDKVMATLACLAFFSTAEGPTQLTPLIHLGHTTYLQCLAVAGALRAGLIREDERKAVEQIRQYRPQSNFDVKPVMSLLDAFRACRPSTFLPDQMVLDWLSRHSIVDRLNAQVVTDWEHQRLHSAFGLVRCMEVIYNLFYGLNVCSDWDQPFWRACLCWAPNTERLIQWELGCLTETQRDQLSKLIDIEGPDVATYQESCLGLSEPICFSYAQVEPQTTALLEQMLALLSRAERVGTNTVDLFIHLLIDNNATHSSIDFLEHVLDQRGPDESHRVVVNLLRSRNHDSLDICTQMTGLSSLLPLLGCRTLPNLSNAFGDPITRVEQVMSAAQREFLAQLESGPGDYVGMTLLAFGRAILASTAIHPRLPPDLLAMVRRFPERDVAESIFERLEDAALNRSGNCSALKSYLVSNLGGCTEFTARDIDLSDIQREIKFWKSHPGPDRRDLATVLAGIRHLDYKAYVTCLASVMYEKDLFVKELRVRLMGKHWGACANLISYVSLRRRHGQLSTDCWTMLVFAFIEEQGSLLARGKSYMRTMDQWLSFIQDLAQLTVPATQAWLRDSGEGLTRQRLVWWQTLSGHAKALRSIEASVKGLEDVEWIFLTGDEAALLTLIDHAQEDKGTTSMSHLVISQLKPGGENLVSVSDMLNSLTKLSRRGETIFQMILTRRTEPQWTNLSLAALCKTWLDSSAPTSADKKVLRMLRQNLKPIPSFTRNDASSLLGQLVLEHDALIERATQLETTRWKLKSRDAREHSKLLHDAGIKDIPFRAVGGGIPPELADAIEEVAPDEYELSFPLTGLNELQRQARGVPNRARLLVARVRLGPPTGFCIHYAPNDETNHHRYWHKNRSDPDKPICGTKPSLFTYCLARNLHRLLMRPQTLSVIHSSIEKWVTTSPSTCGVCGALISIKLWKTAACSKPCSLRLRMAPLEVRLHNLLVDPLSIDLMLSSVYAAALDASALDLLPGCPVDKAKLPAVINSLPPTATLANAPNLSSIFRSNHYGVEQERLLSWLCLSFRGFMRSVPAGFLIPSMPQTQQFLLMNSHHESEKAFETHLGSSAGSGPVFHGTSISRLYLILSSGLKNVSNTPLMAHGAAGGPGIYCGDEQATSLNYSQAIGATWSNSAIDQQMRVMLGCELAKYPTANTPTHIVQDESRVLVRYVFLLPANYHPPPRRHVVPAMSTAFSRLRSGRAT